MARHEIDLTEPSEKFGDFMLIPGKYGYGASVAQTLGWLAHQLVHGTDRRQSRNTDGIPMSISVSAGSANSFFFPQIHGAILGGNSIVSVESHSLFEYKNTAGCSPAGCGGARAIVAVSPMEDFPTRTIRGAVSVSTGTLNREGLYMVDRFTTAAYNGASGYGERVPLDPRGNELARRVLGEMMELGHEFLDPRLQEYAVELARAVPEPVA